MHFQFSFKHMSPSTSLQQYAQDKIKQEIEKFVSKPVDAHVTFTVDNHRHIVHCALSGGDGFSVQVEHECDDMYGSIDRMLDKLTVQLKRKKDRLKEHKPQKGLRKDQGHRFEKDVVDFDNVEIDAEDILKYERARKRLANS